MASSLLKNCKYLSIVVLCILFSGCSISREVIVMSKPQTASIYIDGEYQGIGYVKYIAPKGAQSIEVSCSVEGFPVCSKEVFLSKKLQYVNVTIEELMSYGSQTNSIRNH